MCEIISFPQPTDPAPARVPHLAHPLYPLFELVSRVEEDADGVRWFVLRHKGREIIGRAVIPHPPSVVQE